MLRNILLGIVLALVAVPAAAQDWAVKMFNATAHDFGAVARGAKAQYRFQVQNVYEEDAHIATVRSSCHCTTPTITKQDLKTWETGEVVCEFNTKSFLGFKQATVTVVIDRPFYAEVQLKLSGFIRSDVVLQPGMVDLGTVDHGSLAEKKVAVTYTGREDWKVLDVKSANEHLEVEVHETGRGRGKVTYDLLVRLKDDAPVGYLQDQLFLVTNDPKASDLPVDVEGSVVSEITVSPASLFLGVVQPGQKVTKQLVVRGRKPFKITGVDCTDDCFQIKAPDDAKKVHLVPVVYIAGEQPGKVTRKIHIATDQGENAEIEVTAYAQVVRNEKPSAAKHPQPQATARRDPPDEQ